MQKLHAGEALQELVFSVLWSDGQIVEITAVISLFGFMNRWNDTMAASTPP